MCQICIYIFAIKLKLVSLIVYWNIVGQPERQKPEYAESSAGGLAQFKYGRNYDPEPYVSAKLQTPQLDGALESYSRHITFLKDRTRNITGLLKTFRLEKESYSDKHCAFFY